MNGGIEKFTGNEAALMQQFEIIKEFFQKDSGSEMIGSLSVIVTF